MNSVSRSVKMEPDFERLATLSKLLIGGRTLRKFAELSQLSEGFLSRLTTGKLKAAPTRRSLAKMTSPDCKPQNGISYGDLLKASGYEYTEPLPAKETAIENDSAASLPAHVETTVFPLYLVASVLESTGQLGPSFESRTMRGLFTILPRLDKDIVGIPAFCTEDNVDETIAQTLWNLTVALCTYADKKEEAFFVILTNRQELYKSFDAGPIYGTGGEFYIALTEDYEHFTEQRPVVTVNGDETDKKSKDTATYDLVCASEQTA